VCAARSDVAATKTDWSGTSPPNVMSCDGSRSAIACGGAKGAPVAKGQIPLSCSPERCDGCGVGVSRCTPSIVQMTRPGAKFSPDGIQPAGMSPRRSSALNSTVRLINRTQACRTTPPRVKTLTLNVGVSNCNGVAGTFGRSQCRAHANAVRRT
jgi:hypothetical protein